MRNSSADIEGGVHFGPQDGRISHINRSDTEIHFNSYQNFSNSSNVLPSFDENAYLQDLVVLVILGVMIAVINGLILLSFVMRRNLRKRPANIMICSQACTDLFTALVYIPVFLTQVESTIMFLNCYMLYLSLFNLCLISIDRYLAMNKPFVHRRLINVKRTLKMIIAVWISPLGLTLIPLSWLSEEDPVILVRSWKIFISTIWLLMLVLVVSMSVLYIHASKGAKRTIQNRRTSFQNTRVKARAQLLARKELRVVHLFGLLLSFFVGAYLPILYINFCIIIEIPNFIPPALIPISLYLLIFNSFLNAILCIMLKKDYLYAIKKIFLRYGFTDQMSLTYDESTCQTPDFSRRGTFRRTKTSDDRQRQRMVSDQSDYSSRAPFLTKSSIDSGKRQRMISDQSEYINRTPLLKRAPVENASRRSKNHNNNRSSRRHGSSGKKSLASSHLREEKISTLSRNERMEKITEQEE